MQPVKKQWKRSITHQTTVHHRVNLLNSNMQTTEGYMLTDWKFVLYAWNRFAIFTS